MIWKLIGAFVIVFGMGGSYALLRSQVAENKEDIETIEQNVGNAGAFARFTFCKDIEERPLQECKTAWMREVAQMEAVEAND